MIIVENNENVEMCSKCGGVCCKKYSGAYHPEDLNDGKPFTMESLEALITREEDPVSIDWYEDEDNLIDTLGRGYFIRPRHIGGDIVDPSWGASCINLTENGCKLPFEKRPAACKALIPKKSINDHCISIADQMYPDKDVDDKLIYYGWWKDYQTMIHKLVKKYNKHTYSGHQPPSIWDLLCSQN